MLRHLHRRFFFKKNFCYEVFAKQKKKKCSANYYFRITTGQAVVQIEEDEEDDDSSQAAFAVESDDEGARSTSSQARLTSAERGANRRLHRPSAPRPGKEGGGPPFKTSKEGVADPRRDVWCRLRRSRHRAPNRRLHHPVHPVADRRVFFCAVVASTQPQRGNAPADPASAAAQPIRRCAGSCGRTVCMTRCCTRKQAVNLLLHSTPRSALVLGHAAAAWTRGVDLMSSQVEARLSDRRLGEITSGLKGAITALLAGDSPTIPPRASPLRDPRLANDAND